MSVSKMIGERIEGLMADKNISLRKMANIIGVTHPTLKSYLTGDKVIDSVRLNAVAEYFNVSFDYFFSKDRDKLNLQFRADQPAENLDDFDFRMIDERFRNYLDVVDFGKLKYMPMNYSLSLDGAKLSDQDEENIEKVAYEIRRLFKIENCIPSNYYSVLDNNGINVIASPYENDSFFGASSYSSGNGSFVFVNSNEKIPEERQIFSLIHELGHLLFHRNEYKDPKCNPLYNTARGNVNEKVANSFAGYFLLPRYLVEEYIGARENNVNVIDMKKHFRVSIQALYIALRKYDLISEKQYRDFWDNINHSVWKKAEPEPLPVMDISEKNKRLIESLKRLYAEESISVNRIAEVLEIPLIDARKLVKKWGGLDEFYEHF